MNDSATLKVFDVPMFLWQFVVAWKKTRKSVDFIKVQLESMGTFDKTLGSRLMPELLTPAGEQPRLASPIPKVPRPIADADADADAPVGAQRGDGTTTGTLGATKANNALLGEPSEGQGGQGPTNRAGAKRHVADADADDREDSSEEEHRPARRAKTARPPPVPSQRVHQPPCSRCVHAKVVCYAQEEGTGRGACFRCGRLKVKCSLKDETAMAVATDIPKQNWPMKPGVTMRRKPTAKPRKTKANAPKTAAVVTSSDSESEEAPSPASAKACRRQVSEKAKGKGRGEFWNL